MPENRFLVIVQNQNPQVYTLKNIPKHTMEKIDCKAIAKLAHLGLEDEELISLEKNFLKITRYFEEIVKVDTTALEEKSDQKLLEVFREDQAIPSGLDTSFSPYAEDGYFEVPKMIE